MLKVLAFAGALTIGIGGAMAQTGGTAATKGGMQMTSAQCQTLWEKVDATKAGSVTSIQAQPYVSDFKKADTNSDGKLTSAEFLSACQAGMVKDTATSGSSSGSSSTKSK